MVSVDGLAPISQLFADVKIINNFLEVLLSWLVFQLSDNAIEMTTDVLQVFIPYHGRFRITVTNDFFLGIIEG